MMLERVNLLAMKKMLYWTVLEIAIHIFNFLRFFSRKQWIFNVFEVA